MTALHAQFDRQPSSSSLRIDDVDFGPRFRVMELSLQGRFMRADKSEYPSKMLDISVAHISLTSPVLVAPKEKVVTHFEHVGLLDGTVDKVLDAGFSIRLNITTRKREKLAAQLTWLANRSEFSGLEERRHERVSMPERTVAVQIGERQIQCALLDISLSGASLGTHFRPLISMEVIVGRQHAIVRRHHEQGIGVQFLQVQEANSLQTLLD